MTDQLAIAEFLSFLDEDMARAPRQIKALDCRLLERIDALVGTIPVHPDEELGDDVLL